MDPQRWQDIDRLYTGAVARTGAARRAFLENACAGDQGLRGDLESLLVHVDVTNILDRSPFDTAPAGFVAGSLDRFNGRTIAGRYRILERIGEGGMGVVYLAHDEQLRRPVAVKFLSPVRAASPERLIRFRDEARALSALNHPNIVTVYETGEADSVPFLAMELVGGETLRDKLARGSLPLREALEIARQVAAGVAAAHESGIVHRDLKPENAMVRGDGYVKVLDFGVAGLCEPIQQAAAGHAWRGAALSGLVTGTPPYMAPEQIEGAPADPSNDVFALGVLLCEMTTGANPFRRATIVDTLRAIDDAPVSAEAAIRSLPPPVAALIVSALQRDPARRCVSAAVFGDEARRLAAALDSAAARRVRTRQLRRYAAAAIAVLALAAAAATPSIVRARRAGWVRAIAIPEIGKLTAGDRTVAAFRLLQQAEAILPGDPALLALAQETTRTVTVRTRPGTVVDVRDYLDRSDDWLRLGTAPLDKIRVPAGYLAWRASSGGQSYTIAPPTADTTTIDVDALAAAPPGMVPVRAQRFFDYLAYFGWLGPYDLPPFFIDRVEVTNRDFQKFVDAGGYRRAEFWTHPFTTGGRTLSWAQAIDRFRDRSGSNGPSTWEGGHYLEGRADYPVSGVSWFEAAAYAQFVGKTLPVLAQSYVTTPPSLDRYLSKVSDVSETLLPAAQSRTLGPYGTYDQQGNVREWYRNSTPDGQRYTLGRFPASYGPSTFDPFDRAALNGFRCVINTKPLAPDVATARPILRRDFSTAAPAPDATFNIYRDIYSYDRAPLRASVAPAGDTAGWTVEKAVVDAAYGNERLPLYLFLPKQARRPLQAVVFFPSARVLNLTSSQSLGDLTFIDYVVKSGRAVVYPVYEGLYERRSEVTPSGGPTVLRDTIVAWSRDFGRAIDYLETRPDIDASRVGFLGVSMGSAYGVILTSLEKRVKAVVLLDGGFFQIQQPAPGTDQVDFAARVTQPVLMVNGRFDATYVLETSQLPLFRLLGSPSGDKRHVLFETAHDVRGQRADLTREVLGWFDKYLGPAK